MALREIIARFGFQFDQGGLKKAQTGIAGVVGSLQTLGVTIGAGIVARGIKNFVTGMVDAGDALGKTATQLGLSSKELQAWQQAASFAGVQTESLNQGFRILGKNALLAQQGSKQAGDAFKTLGVEIETANGQLKPANQLAREAGVALGNMEDRTKAVGLAQQVFGRAGAALLPLFAKGAEGLDEALAKLEEFGGGLSDELIPLAEAAQDRFTEFEIATTSLKSKLAVALLPALNQLTLGLSKAVSFISKSGITAENFKAILVALGLVLGKLAIAKFGASLLQLGRAALLPLAKFILLFLVVDDLIALFEGRGSVIGTFIDKVFGKGTAASVVNAIKSIGTAVGDLLKTGDFKKFDEDLEAIFGPPGQDIVADIVFTFDLVKEALDKFIDETGEGLDLVIADFKTWVGDLGEAIAAGAIGISNDAIDFATALVDGIVKGIKDGADAVLKALTGIVKDGITGAKKLLGIDSPSKVAAKEIGSPFIQGIGMGALDAARAAARVTAGAALAATSLAAPSSISAPARGAVGGATGGVVFQSDIALSVSGGSASDPQIQKLRQGVRSELRDNRRATLDALNQVIEAPA
jgi:hypothetical protein